MGEKNPSVKIKNKKIGQNFPNYLDEILGGEIRIK
jgi:hypothetical protein